MYNSSNNEHNDKKEEVNNSSNKTKDKNMKKKSNKGKNKAKNSNNNNELSNKKSGLKKDEIEKSKNSGNKIDKYIKKYSDRQSLEELELKELDKLFKDIISVSYNNSTPELQLILMNINWIISEKNKEEIDKMAKKVHESSLHIEKVSTEVNKISDDMNNMLGTIISIIVSFSLVSSAVVGIEKLQSFYIIPFILSIIIIEMTIVLFIFSFYKENINKKAIGIFIICLLITIVCWLAALFF